MIVALCQECLFGIRTLGDAREEDLFMSDAAEGKLRCPKCTEPLEVHNSISSAAMNVVDIRDLTVTEAYRAMNGLGLPEEQECSPTAIRMALQSPIKKVNVRAVKGSTRSVVDSLELESGAVIYFGASPYGAIVYRIANG